MALPKQLRCFCLVLLFTGSLAMGAEPTGLKVTKVIKSKVDVGMTIKGAWGTFINGKSYQRMPLDTYKGWQYTTYYDQKQRLSIARRKLPAGSWQVIHFDDYLFKSNDNHNVTVLGICRKDGTIHLAFDHHCSPLHYRVSQKGVATNPEKVEWKASLFGEVRYQLQEGHSMKGLTYPRFVPTPEGNLLFVSRAGRPTQGRVTLCEYDPTKEGWTGRWNATSLQGTYKFQGMTSESRYAYLNGVHYGPNGRLHMSWVWREAMGRAVRDLNYAYSDDHGRTWCNSDGAKVGSEDELVGTESPGVVVWDIDPCCGLELQMGQYVDGLDRPHIIISHRREGEEPFDLGSRPEERSAYYHYWRNAKGEWHQNEVSHPVGGGADSQRNRPKILSTANNDLIAMFNNKAQIVLLAATAENQYRDWKVIHREDGPWNGEPLPDLSRWREEGVLSIYMQKDPSKGGEPTDLYVVDFDIAETGSN